MKEIKGNIWDYHKQGHWIVITTNGNVKANGEAVMGKGIALQAKQKFPLFPRLLGRSLRDHGNHCYLDWGYGLITFPTKHNWREMSSLELISSSCKELFLLAEEVEKNEESEQLYYMVRPGCGNGRLDWTDVKSILEKYLDDRFVIVER